MVTTAWHRTQGDLRGMRTVFMLRRAEEPPAQESERPYEQGSALTGVEQRGAGRGICDGRTTGRPVSTSAADG